MSGQIPVLRSSGVDQIGTVELVLACSWNDVVIGGAEGGRTPDLRIANAALCQTELLPHTRGDDIRYGRLVCQAAILPSVFVPRDSRKT